MSDEAKTGIGPGGADERLRRSDLPEGERPCLVARGRPRAGAPSEPEAPRAGPLTAEQRLLILDAWQRSGLPAGDFGSLVGVSGHTLYAWKRRFEEYGPAEPRAPGVVYFSKFTTDYFLKFVDNNFHRPHQGIDGLTPADRFFEAEPEVLRTLRARVAPRAGELARDGLPRKAFYLTGRVGDAGISLHAEGERIVLTTDDGMRGEVDLAAPGRRADEEEQIELPAVVTPAAREVEDGEDEAEADGDGAANEVDALECEPGDGDGGGEEDGGGGAGGAGRAADAGGGGSEPGGLDGTVVLEMRALQGVVIAPEPRARGRALTAARRVQGLECEKTKLTHEVLRTQGLLRAAQRALGIVPGPVVATPGPRRRRASVRGAAAAATLRRLAEGSDDEARDEARSSGGPDGPGPAA